MKRQQKAVWATITVLIGISILFGATTFVFGQARIDGAYMDVKTTDVNRAISMRPDTFGESALLVGTNKGTAMFAKLSADEMPLKTPVYKPFVLMQQTNGLVRDIIWTKDKGYMLKSDGIYTSDASSKTWTQLVSVNELPKEAGSVAELWSMSFATESRVCIAGVYLKNTSDRSIDKELLFCTENISANKIRWEESEKPKNRKNEQIQFTNIYFDKYQKGWVVGTDGAEGVIWYSRNGGREWEELDVAVASPLLSVAGTGNKVFGVGFNGLVFGNGGSKNNSGGNSSSNKPIEGDKVRIKGRVLSRIPGIVKVIGKVEKVRENGMLKVKITEVMPEKVKEIVEELFKTNNNEVSPQDAEKIDEETSNDSVSETWNKVDVSRELKNQTPSLRSIKFTADGKDGFIVGDKGTILYSSDSGANWKLVPIVAPYAQFAAVDFYSIFIDEKYCWVAGSKGAIVRIKYK